MSEQRTVVHPLAGERVITPEDKVRAAAEVAKLTARKEKKARIARVLERGYIVDRLTVELPKDLHGEWVPIDQIERWEALGFSVDKEHAFKRQLHPDGSGDRTTGGTARVGDVMFMTCSQEDFEIMQELKHEMFIKTHGSPGEKKALSQKEEQEFKNLVETEIGLPVVDEGKEHPARREQIQDAIKATQQRLGEQPPAGLAEMGKGKQ